MMEDNKKKRSFWIAGVAIGIALSLGAGAVLMTFGGYRLISEKEAGEYKHLKETYRFADGLMQLVKDQYYLPVEDDQDLMEGMYKGIVKGLNDPYSEYLNEEEMDALYEELQGSYCGVGVTMSMNDDNYIEVIAVTDDSPAERAGILGGDLIIGVDDVTYTGDRLSEAAEMIRGEEGTMVTLTILRGEEIKTFEIKREKLNDITVTGQIIEENLGYLRITGFEMKTAEQFSAELKKLEDADVDGLIIDIRNNGGGLVEAAVDVADELMDAATVVYAENRAGERSYYKTENGKTELPYVFLVNEMSVSAAEILAAGIQEYGGLLVGTQTYGKGIIQTTQPLVNGGALKLTTMQYYTPSGKTIHEIGITPDVVVEQNMDDVDEQGYIRDLQLEKAVELFAEVE